jgi:hypothetical protein
MDGRNPMTHFQQSRGHGLNAQSSARLAILRRDPKLIAGKFACKLIAE